MSNRRGLLRCRFGARQESRAVAFGIEWRRERGSGGGCRLLRLTEYLFRCRGRCSGDGLRSEGSERRRLCSNGSGRKALFALRLFNGHRRAVAQFRCDRRNRGVINAATAPP